MPDDSRRGFLDELKRRNVHRVAFAYVVGAWALIQVAETIFPYIGFPDRAITFVIVLVAIGLVPALIVAWVFEITPEGVVRDEGPSQADESPKRHGLRTFDYVVMCVLTVLVTLFAFDQFAPDGTTPTFTGEPSIAVLPFENRSGNPNDVYFVDGIHDDIIASLAKIGAMKVIARTSVERYTNTGMSIAEIGAELGVATILEGGVQRAGETVRINVNLVDASDETSRWVGNFERRLSTENIFAIQSEISQTVADSLQAVMTPAEKLRIDLVPTDSLEAYELYLLGNQRIQRRTGEALDEAIDYFERAIELDPEFALAYVGLADSLNLSWIHGGKDRAVLLEPSLAAANKAIALDPNLGEAYASLGHIHREQRTGEDPEPFYLRAIELSPNYAPAHTWYAQFLGSRDGGRRYQTQLKHREIALELDPLSPLVNTTLGWSYIDNNRVAAGEARLRRAIEIDPDFAFGYQELSHFHRQFGRYADSYLTMRKAIELNPAGSDSQVMQIGALVHLGDLEAAQRQIDLVRERYPHARWLDYPQAMVDLARNDEDSLKRAREAIAAGVEQPIHRGIVVGHLMSVGDYEGALEMLATPIPRLGIEAIGINRSNYYVFVGQAGMLMRLGRQEEANELLDRVSRFIESNWSFDFDKVTPIQDQLYPLLRVAEIRALQGDERGALDAIRKAVDNGWVFYWFWYLYHNSNFDLIKDHPEYLAMREEVRSNIAGQLARVKAELGDDY